MLTRIACLLVAMSLLLVARASAQLVPERREADPSGTRAVETFRTDAIHGAASVSMQQVQGGSPLSADSPAQRWHEPIEIALSLGVLAFGATLIFLFTRALLRLGRDWRTIYLRLVVLLVVVTAGLFALTAGYTEQQISPMMGLLGTLVGYLLGRESNSPVASESTPAPATRGGPGS